MLKSLRIENFRRFELFELEDLGRVNLLVGMNNSGKTSILEAIQLLCSQTNLYMLNQSMIRRGEHTIINHPNQEQDIELDIYHLFFGHKIDLNKKCSITAIDRDENTGQVTLSIQEDFVSKTSKSGHNNETRESHETYEDSFKESPEINFTVKWFFGDNKREFQTTLSPNGGIIDRALAISQARYDTLSKVYEKKDDPSTLKTQFLSSSSLLGQEIADLFDQISLMPEETLLYEAMRILEPKIERIVTVGKSRNLSPSGGFFLRLSDSKNRIPLGSLGDGTVRMLGLALALINSKGGALLVDDIDTGLHFTALSDMWKFIWKVSKQLDVQVFATTHSRDCWQSLASIASLEETETDGITIQRIEEDKQKAVAFPREGIVIAAEDEIEVR